MPEDAQMQTMAVDFSRRLEQETFISATFVRLNVLAYKRAAQSFQMKQK